MLSTAYLDEILPFQELASQTGPRFQTATPPSRFKGSTVTNDGMLMSDTMRGNLLARFPRQAVYTFSPAVSKNLSSITTFFNIHNCTMKSLTVPIQGLKLV